MQIKLGQAQIKTLLGNVETNLETHMRYIEEAKEQAVDLLVFPELSLTGYLLQDLSYSVAMKPTSDNPVFKPLYEASHDLDIVVGFVEEDSRSRLYIASAYLSGGELLHMHRKLYLPTYTMFDDARYFGYGDDIRAFDTRFGRIGILICEDFWHASPPYLLWLDGADLMLFPSASPGRGINGSKLGTAKWVEQVVQAYAALFTSYVSFTNRVGFEDGYVFWGGSMAFGPDGEKLSEAPYLDEFLNTSIIDFDTLGPTRSGLPLLRDERPELTLRTLNRILAEQTPIKA